MRHASGHIVVVLAILASAGVAWAASVPWKGNADVAAKPATLDEIKADLGDVRFKRMVASIDAKVALAEKAMAPYEKEMEKPPEKRRTDLLQKCKVRSAQMYMEAAKAALRAQNTLHKATQRACIKETYEDPNRQKAIRIYQGLGLDARAQGNIPQAAFFYKQVLAIDPDNAEGKVALKELALEYRQALQDQKYRGKNAGGSSEDRKAWDWDYGSDHKRDYGNWRNYTGNGNGGWW